MIRIAVSVLLLALVAFCQQPPAQPQAPPSCTDQSVTAEQISAGQCSCPAPQPGVAIRASFTWTNGSGAFDIDEKSSAAFNWFVAKNCHKYAVMTIPVLDQQGKPVIVNGKIQTVKVKLPPDKWTLQLWYVHNKETLVDKINEACAGDSACAANMPELKAAQDEAKAAADEAAAAKEAAAATALQPVTQ